MARPEREPAATETPAPPRNRRLRPLKKTQAEAAAPEETQPKRPPWRVRWRQRVQRLRRPLRVLGRVVMTGLVLSGCIAVGRLAHEYVHTAPAFDLQELHVHGAERLDRAEVLETAGLERGLNVFAVAPEIARGHLVNHPWIASAKVERRLPGTMRLWVRERHAAAILALGEELYLVGDDGTLFKGWEPSDPADLPIVTGVERRRFVADRPYRTSLLLEVVALMHDYRAAGLWRREPIGEMRVAGDEITLFVGEDALEVRLGRGPFRIKLRRLRRVLDRLDERESRAFYVYLDNVRRPDRVTVRLREEPEPEVPDADEDAT